MMTGSISVSRYTLHEQVYFHKTTRCVEHMIAKLLRRVAEHTKQPEAVPDETGLRRDAPRRGGFETRPLHASGALRLAQNNSMKPIKRHHDLAFGVRKTRPNGVVVVNREVTRYTLT
jgi:HD superfamily phosphohydrolase